MISFTKNVAIIAALTFIILASTAGHLTEEDIALLKEEFMSLDKDGDNALNINEFQEIMSKTGENLSKDKIRWLFIKADTDGSGTINFDQFMTIMDNLYDIDCRNNFRTYDKNNKGYISGAKLDQFKYDLRQYFTDEEINNYIGNLDAVEKITYEEYNNLMDSLISLRDNELRL